ncbi:MAG TPA: hypothetical protein VME40_16620 [Caulobacteraceae bacterium]|nr:hypothetical protein [Caulobacteraceae bacterium]
MRSVPTVFATLPALLAAGALLGACAESQLRDQPDFGNAVRQDRSAQIADPDAHYAGVPEPGSNGLRVDTAQERYVKDTVIQPVQTQTTTALPGSNGNGNSSGAGAQAPSSGQ